MRVGELVIDPARWKVLVREREVRLTKLEFRLLRLLASDPTRLRAWRLSATRWRELGSDCGRQLGYDHVLDRVNR